MRTHTLPLLALCAVASGAPLEAQDASDSPGEPAKFLTGNVTLSLASGQVYRGERLTKEGSPTLGANVSLTFGGLVTAFASGSYDTQTQTATRRDGTQVQLEERRFSQKTFGLSIAKDTKVANLSLTGSYVQLDQGSDNPKSGTLASVFHVPLSPGISFTREFGSSTGWYLAPSLSPTIPLSETWRIDIVANAGYYLDADVQSRAVSFSQGFVPDRNPGAVPAPAPADSYSGWSDANASATLVYAGPHFSATLGGTYTTFLSDEPQRRLRAEGESKGTFTASLSIGYSF